MAANEFQKKLKDWEEKTLIISKAVEWGVIEDLEELLNATSTKKRYPRMPKWSEEKQKIVYVADKSKPQYETTSAVGFFEVKAKFIHDVCGLPSLAKPEEPDFRAKIRAAAEAARKAQAAAGDDIDEKLGFKK